MKIIMIYDQIQSGAGIKDDHDIPLGAKKEAVGPAVMMEPFLKKVDGKVVACLYCGDGTYLKNPDEVSRKLCAMVNKLKPDVVMCGPCFNYLNYGKMAARIAYDINQNTSSKLCYFSAIDYIVLASTLAIALGEELSTTDISILSTFFAVLSDELALIGGLNACNNNDEDVIFVPPIPDVAATSSRNKNKKCTKKRK